MRRLALVAVVVWSLIGVAPSTAGVSCPAGTHVERFGDAKKGEEWCVKDAGGGRHGPLHGWVRGFTIDGTFTDGKADGTFTGRWPNGRPTGEVALKSGVAPGKLVAWHDNLRLLGECTFTDGKVTTPLELFDAEGRKRAVFEPTGGGRAGSRGGIIHGMRSTIDSAGRLVIPKDVRREAGLRSGMPVEVVARNGRVEIEPAPLPVRLVKKGRLLVAVPRRRVPPMTAETVERTRERLRGERG